MVAPRLQATILPGPIGDTHGASNEELVHVLRAKGCRITQAVAQAMLAVPRDVFVSRDRQREAFRCAASLGLVWIV